MKFRCEVFYAYEPEDSDMVKKVLARAVDVDGLVRRRTAVEREVVVLRGCSPAVADVTGALTVEVIVEFESSVDAVAELDGAPRSPS